MNNYAAPLVLPRLLAQALAGTKKSFLAHSAINSGGIQINVNHPFINWVKLSFIAQDSPLLPSEVSPLELCNFRLTLILFLHN